MIDQLVCVIGQHRGGTSLMSDLVRECGYKFDHVLTSPNLRLARNEGPRRIGMPGQTIEDTTDTLHEQDDLGINAIKLTKNLPMWLGHIQRLVDDLRFVVVTRDPEAISKSRLEGIYDFPPYDCTVESIVFERGGMESLVKSLSVPTIHFSFEQLLKKDVNMLRRLCDFLDSFVEPTDLLDLIHPEVVKWG